MIEDLRKFPPGTTITADICLIGAGAAGITIARELAGSALRVCMVEGGGTQFEYQESQDCMRAIVRELRSHWKRVVCASLAARRTIGQAGAPPSMSLIFGGADWIPHSGWPIDRVELDPYYVRAPAR